MEDDDDLIPLSALQHYLYCPRQCGLIHIERQWAENRFTAEGRLLHEKADSGGGEKRGKTRSLHALPLRSVKYRLTGVADVVELRGTKTAPLPCPVEYKRGKPKSHRADEVQLCAQALCLEEMFGVAISEGALFYGGRCATTAIPWMKARGRQPMTSTRPAALKATPPTLISAFSIT